jgi:hypothetical protein
MQCTCIDQGYCVNLFKIRPSVIAQSHCRIGNSHGAFSQSVHLCHGITGQVELSGGTQ